MAILAMKEHGQDARATSNGDTTGLPPSLPDRAGEEATGIEKLGFA